MSAAAAATILDVRSLVVDYRTGPATVRAVAGVSFEIGAGETLALVGPSGSGKTSTALAVLGLLPARARATGRVVWEGRDLLGLGHSALRPLRGAAIGLVQQDPMTALHPLRRVDRQVAEAFTTHAPHMRRRDAHARAAALLERMGVPPARLAHAGFPHQWSGGMRQRALIAMAVANRPRLLIVDEPTTALDRATRAAVFELLREARHEAGAAMLLITHEPDVVAELADRVAVMREGRIVQTGSPGSLAWAPELEPEAEPGVLPAARSGDDRATGGRATAANVTGAPATGGRAPDARVPDGRATGGRATGAPASGGRATPASPDVRPASAGASRDPGGGGPPASANASAAGFVAGHGGASAAASSPAAHGGPNVARILDAATPEVLRVEDLEVRYPLRPGRPGRPAAWVHAVNRVSFALAQGETLGVVGESGAGKSTLARALVGLERPAAGRVLVLGREITRIGGAALRAARADIQIVFQDHAASLNPRRRIGASIAQPLRIHGRYRGGTAGERQIARLLECVGLPAGYARRYPHELSGGERQRVAMARALALEPRVLVLDEPMTSLDVVTRQGILHLLRALRDERGLALVLIAHDPRLVRILTHRIAVMHRGRIIEGGPAPRVRTGSRARVPPPAHGS